MSCSRQRFLVTGKAQSHDYISEIGAEVNLGFFASQSCEGIAGVDQFIPAINTYLLSSYYVLDIVLESGDIAVNKTKSLFHGA